MQCAFENRMFSVPMVPQAARAPVYTGFIPPMNKPRQRGRPRKVPLNPSAVNHRENSVNDMGTIVKVIMRSIKEKNKPVFTVNNGFSRGLKPDIIMAGFLHNDQLVFAVRFKNRKLPELISPMELKLRAPGLLIQYYVYHLRHTYNN